MSIQPQKMLLVAASTAAMVTLVACEGSLLLELEGDSNPPIQTDRTRYELREGRAEGDLEVEIPYAYHNVTGKTVYFPNCLGHVLLDLQKRIDGEWVRAWVELGAGCLSQPIAVAPGATYLDTLRLYHHGAGQTFLPRFTVKEIEGIYRLVAFSAVHDYDPDGGEGGGGEPLPLRHRVSNEFVLREP